MIKKSILQKVSKQIKAEFPTSKLGRCYYIAQRAKELLAQEGIETTLVKGEAAFRVGDSELANVAFVQPTEGLSFVGNPEGLFHYWLKDETGRILDFTAFTLRAIIAATDRAEIAIKPTKVNWCPDYLYVKRSECVSIYKVRTTFKSGLFAYRSHK